MPSMLFSNKMSVMGHWLFVIICVALGVKYELEPLHSVRGTTLFTGLSGTISGFHPSLEPHPDTMTGAHPLIDYGPFEFVGCDLALRAGQRVLITNWRGVFPGDNLTLIVRFVAPTLNKQVASYQHLDGNIVEFNLPKWFHETVRLDETWLNVSDPTGYRLPVHRSLIPNTDNWFRVCE